MSKQFRDLKKEALDIRAPIDVALEFRLEAIRQGRSVSDLGSEAIIRFLGRTPADYGITGPKREAQTA